jgi:hypothetical protein
MWRARSKQELETLSVHQGIAGIEADGPVSTRAAAVLASLPK